jgi:hypothetical protein
LQIAQIWWLAPFLLAPFLREGCEESRWSHMKTGGKTVYRLCPGEPCRGVTDHASLFRVFSDGLI